MRLGLMTGYSGAKLELPMALIKEADRLGYYAVWTAEAYGSDCVTPLAWIGAQTQQIHLGTAIMQMPARTPAMTAMTAITLDQLSGGRMLLGLGLSGPQVVEGWHGTAYGKPLGRTREYVKIVRTIFAREERLVHNGKQYQIPYKGEDATGLGKPLKSILHGRADLPIYIAAIGPKNVQLSAEIGDGWLPIFFSPTHYADIYAEHVEAGFARADADKDLSNFDIAPTVSVVVGDDVEACRNRLKPMLALYVGGMGAKGKNFYYDLVSRYGFADAAEQVQELFLAGKKMEAAAAIPDALVDEIALCGPRERIKERLMLWEKSPITTMNITAHDIATVRTMAELVLGSSETTISLPTHNEIQQKEEKTETEEPMSTEAKSAAVFDGLAKRVAKRDELSKIDALFQFEISGDPGGSWVVDLTTTPGSVREEVAEKADCTISMTDDDFVALTSGDLDPTTAFMQGKIKVKGDMGLVMKLQKILG